jgi:hypothetical protein
MSIWDQIDDGHYFDSILKQRRNPTMATATTDTTKRFWAVIRWGQMPHGPYATLENARQEAARLLAREGGWEQYFVMEMVGMVMKPIPEMMWSEPTDAPLKLASPAPADGRTAQVGEAQPVGGDYAAPKPS